MRYPGREPKCPQRAVDLVVIEVDDQIVGSVAREFLTGKGVDVDAVARLVDGKFLSAFVRAVKPGGAVKSGCCG